VRCIIQRVTHASCTVNGTVTGSIGTGLLLLLGVEADDTLEDLAWLAKKIAGIRIFGDESGQMNRSLADVNGRILLISQFTLFAETKRGNRPGFTRAARPDVAVPLYEAMIRELGALTGTPIQTGVFGADMKIELLNDGPVTIIIDTRNKE
jgi:D-aminoacyl-tRNA deacylase